MGELFKRLILSKRKMKIERVAEHSFCPELLPEGAKVLDLGCRGFLFSNHFAQLEHQVFSIDIDEDVLAGQYVECSTANPHFKYVYLNEYIVKYKTVAIAEYDGYGSVLKTNDPQATRFISSMVDKSKVVDCIRLDTLSKMAKVEFWDLIKIDIEGYEREVIMSLTEPPAKQLSIEFHLHTGIYTKHDVDVMVSKLESLGYEAVQHNMTSEHGCGLNMWDSLFILK